MSWTAPLKNHSKERASLTPIKAKKAGVGNADWGLAMTVAASERCSQWPPAGVRLGAGSLLPQSKIPETAGEFQPFTLAQPLRPVCGIAATPAAIVSVFWGIADGPDSQRIAGQIYPGKIPHGQVWRPPRVGGGPRSGERIDGFSGKPWGKP